ncbi:MAG: hypothetical protein HYY18_21475 [Planctomycetes bacterium]|nr:hypothetical protein [Planctomycetota bacterium]
MIHRCAHCASWFDLRRFPACPVCGRPGVSPPKPAAPPFAMPASFDVEREAARDQSASGWTIPAGILLGLGGPYVLYRMAGKVTIEVVVGFLFVLAMVAILGLSGRSGDEPARFAAGRVAATAILTIAIGLAIAALIGGALVVLAFVACVNEGVKW